MKRNAALSIILLGSVLILILLSFGSQSAQTAVIATTVLYDASLGSTPDEQNFVYQTNPPIGAQATQSYSGGATTLDTTAVQGESAGYFAWPAAVSVMPTLDRSSGFTITFTLQVTSEVHAGSDKNGDGIEDRAGFSLIVISDDLMGIELGFWEDEVWAQEDGSHPPPAGDLFTHAEGASFDTTRDLITYELEIVDNVYTLAAAGLTLSGPLRDYKAFGGFPYATPNLIFLGDDTSSAAAEIKLSYVTVTEGDTPPPPPPDPTSQPAVYLPLIVKPETGQKKRTLGEDLLSQGVAPPVPSALTSLTAGFGMGPGVASSLNSPRDLFNCQLGMMNACGFHP